MERLDGAAYFELPAPEILGGLVQLGPGDEIAQSIRYRGETEGGGLAWIFQKGSLATAKYLTADFLLSGDTLTVFALSLQEGAAERVFRFVFGGLNECSFRFRMPLELVNQNLLVSDREGGFLLPMTDGDVVDLAQVDRMTLTIRRKASAPVLWCMTQLRAATREVPQILAPALPKGPLRDEMGQSTIRNWPTKTRSSSQLTARMTSQLEQSSAMRWPPHFSRWGGWNANKISEGSGYFRTHHDGRRWWLVDPDGFAFWSAGVDCVRIDCDARYDQLESALSWMPDRDGEFREIYSRRKTDRGGQANVINYLAANFIRAFGPENWREKWAQIAYSELRRVRFNTVGNWSDWQTASKAQFPYVRPLDFSPKRTPLIYRELPDVYHPDFGKDASEFAAQLASTISDRAFIGYFLMNEPTWGFSKLLPAEGVLYNSPPCHTRSELVRYLQRKYSTDQALTTAWKMPASFNRLRREKWQGMFTTEARQDLREFSTQLTEDYFGRLSAACRAVDPHHLNLGIRWAGVPPDWAIAGMKAFDVFSQNCYRPKFPIDVARTVDRMLRKPVIVGEYHFGSLDAGLPASGIGRVGTQYDRGRAYRIYLEDTAADPYCIGAHWFILYDESALGRYDGENYNIGFLDICNRPYEPLASAAALSHERMYEVAAGKLHPFRDAPAYLPPLY